MSTTRSRAALIERVTRAERMVAVAEAARAEAILDFARAEAAAVADTGVVEPQKLENSIVAQVGLACRVSPHVARRRIRTARDLHDGHARVREMFAAGELNEYKVATITAATAHLSAGQRAEVDGELARQQVETMSVRRVEAFARSLAAQAAPEEFLARQRAARTGRRVTVRPAADGTADLTAHLPVEEAVACYAALRAAVNEVAVSPEPVTRGRGQVMADTLVERITGQAVASDVNIEIQVVVPVEALVDPGSPVPAQIPGHGPVPVALLVSGEGRKVWRRLVTREGIVIGGESRQRCFTGNLAALVRARDGERCREPFCDAPVRHIDHIERWSGGGRTEFDNGRGLCVFHNHVRETGGWRAEDRGGWIVTITPTGTEYASDPHRMPPVLRPRPGVWRLPGRHRQRHRLRHAGRDERRPAEPDRR